MLHCERTSSRMRLDETYHNEYSSLEELAIDMVNDFPLDGMHLIYIGVVRKILQYIVSEPQYKLRPTAIHSLNKFLDRVAHHTPRSDFARKCRSLEYLSMFKATELRLFLLYIGPVVLKSRLTSDRFNNFMTLHKAVKILASPQYCRAYSDYAKSLMSNFVENASILYGNAFVTYNVHNLIHISDDVKRFGPLDSFSAFPFESYLGKIKGMLRKHDRPLQQVVKRIIEKENNRQISLINDAPPFKLNGEHSNGPILSSCQGTQFEELDLKNTHLTTCVPDNCVMFTDGSIVLIENFVHNEKIFLIGRKYEYLDNLYDFPIESSIFDVWKVDGLSVQLNCWPLEQMKCKVFHFPICGSDSFACFPINLQEPDVFDY